MSEHLVYDGKAACHPWKWEKIPGHDRNEALDCRELEKEAGHFHFYQEITPFSTNVRPKDEDTCNYHG